MSAALTRDRLEAQIARERDALAETLEELRVRTTTKLDLRQRVRERPSAWLGGALLVGFCLALRR